MATVLLNRVLSDFKIENRCIEACTFDREADALLQFGFWKEAERLAHRAQAMREAAQWPTSISSAAHLHRLGERAIAEFLAEIGHECGCTDAITDRLGAWRADRGRDAATSWR